MGLLFSLFTQFSLVIHMHALGKNVHEYRKTSFYVVQETSSHITCVNRTKFCMIGTILSTSKPCRCCRWLSSGLLCREVWYKFTDVSEVPPSSGRSSRSWPDFMSYSGSCQEGLRKATKILGKDNGYPG
jgi:hypothetical protein